MLARLRTRVSAVFARVDGLVERAAVAGRNWLIWPFLYAITTGSGLWMLVHRDRLPAVATNKVGAPQATQMALWVAAALGVLALVYAGATFRDRRRAGAWSSAAAGELNRRLRFLLALPILPALALPKIEVDKPELTFFFAALAAGLVGWAVYGWTRSPSPEPALAAEQPGPEAIAPAEQRRERLRRVGAAAAVAALWAGYGLFFSRLSITNHHALNTRTIDLGYYDNIFYQSIHGRPLGCTLIRGGWHGSAHFDPLLVLLSPLYLLYPRAELILILQSVWVGSGVVPLYLITRERLGRRLPGVVLGFMYALYPALQGANMYEFHSLTLLSPLILWVLYFLERGSLRAYFLMLIPTLLLREDVPLLLCFVGLYAILSRRPGYARVGWVTIILCGIYFVVVKRFIMPSPEIFMSGKEALSFAYYYEELIPNKNGVTGLVISVLSNPAFVLKHVFSEPKVRYLLTLFLPLLFLPFLARTGRVMLVYGLLFCFLASRTAVFSPAFQYSSVILPIAFALVPQALRRIEDGHAPAALGLDGPRLSRALLGAALVSSLLVSWKFGAILPNEAFRGGFGKVTRTLNPEQQAVHAWLREQIDRIPRGASVGVTNKLGPHASNRKEVYFYPGSGRTVDWLLIDEGEIKGNDIERHNQRVQRGEYVLVSRYKNSKMALFERRPGAAPLPPVAPSGSPSAAPGTAAPAAPKPPTPAPKPAQPGTPTPRPEPTDMERPEPPGEGEEPGGGGG